MSSGPPRGDKWERDVRSRLWESGWAVVRAAGSGTWENACADIVAIRDGVVLILEVKSVPRGEFRRDVSDSEEQLKEIRRRSLGNETEVHVGYAVYVKSACEWYYLPCGNPVITQADLEKKLYEVTI